ncbi:MAG: histidine phosphatase family protein [Victivallaceae bacterium]|nr:histidine phosphatase family protein [Victivallaceae bacterium]
MKKLILIRHGAVERKYDGCYLGTLDVPLAPEGRKQAAALGRCLGNIVYEHIFASPMLRVKQTLEAALPAAKLAGVEYREELREINFGDWEGRTFPEIVRHYPEEANAWAEGADGFSFPNGGNLKEFYDRISAFKQNLLAVPGSTFMIFTHGGVILTLICSVLGLRREKMLGFKVERGSVSSVELFENGFGILTGLNLRGNALWQK